jgi:hypothetical protein
MLIRRAILHGRVIRLPDFDIYYNAYGGNPQYDSIRRRGRLRHKKTAGTVGRAR